MKKRTEIIRKRNEEIFKKRKYGVSGTMLAKEYGLSRNWVYHIIGRMEKEKGERIKKPFRDIERLDADIRSGEIGRKKSEGMSYRQLSIKYKVSWITVRTHLKKFEEQCRLGL